MFTALLTVTVPPVFPPSVLKSVASKLSPALSLTVIVIKSVPDVDRSDRLANEEAAILPVITPALGANAFSSATLEASLISTVAEAATTLVSSVTNAAVTSSVSPWMFTALLTVTVAPVFPPIALKSVASMFVVPASVIVTNAVLATTLVSSVTNAAVT